MPTKIDTPKDDAPVEAVPSVGDIALDDWCQAKSRALGRRVEALSAFYRRAQREGLGRATQKQLDDAFAAFLKRPA